ncbi:hypothetical protein MNBD_GAMMA21-840 [hydrothermal vent metagenome]|uniref:Uncharacterized protein n=1 Tax=hydrothermal vent metagenome TaxID=652676 RepID=A0A3B1AFL4_9ZZZZ
MNTRLSILVIGHATSLFLIISYTLCVVFDLIFPGYAMHEAWHKLLPGFEWISWKGFFIGLIETYAYGWFFALIWVPLYNVFVARYGKT